MSILICNIVFISMLIVLSVLKLLCPDYKQHAHLLTGVENQVVFGFISVQNLSNLYIKLVPFILYILFLYCSFSCFYLKLGEIFYFEFVYVFYHSIVNGFI